MATELIRNIFKISGSCLAHSGQHKVSKIQFLLESSDFVIGNKSCQLFPLKLMPHFTHF